MPNSYKAIIENGQIKWLDTPPPETNAKVIVTVLAPVKTNTLDNTDSNPKKRQLGFMQGEMTLPDDINWGDDQIQDFFEGNE